MKMHCTDVQFICQLPLFDCIRPVAVLVLLVLAEWSKSKQHRSLGPRSFFKHLYTLSPGRFQFQYSAQQRLLGKQQWCLWGVWADTLQSSWLTVGQLTDITKVMKVIANLTVVILVYPCSIEIISILYQQKLTQYFLSILQFWPKGRT